MSTVCNNDHGTHSDSLGLTVHLQWAHALYEVDILEVYGWRSPLPLLEKKIKQSF